MRSENSTLFYYVLSHVTTYQHVLQHIITFLLHITAGVVLASWAGAVLASWAGVALPSYVGVVVASWTGVVSASCADSLSGIATKHTNKHQPMRRLSIEHTAILHSIA